MPWRNTTMANEKLSFITKALDSTTQSTFKDLCEQYSISSKTGYKWINRYINQGLEGLIEMSRAPLNHPSKIAREVEECIIWIRKNHARLGPKKIQAIIKRDHPQFQPPSESTIGNILKRHNLAKPQRHRRHVAKTAPLGECSKPNHVWMYDFKGFFNTADGAKCEPLTITDGHSRYLLGCVHMDRKREEDVWKVMEKLFLKYGLPDRLRSDNGPPFASLGVGRLSLLAIKLIKLGIIPEWIAPGCPQENGRHERFHLTLKMETAMPPAENLEAQIKRFERFIDYYNNWRPHEALGQVAPSKVYKVSTRTWDGKFRSPEYDEAFAVRKIQSAGHATWRGYDFFVSERLVGEYVGIKPLEEGILGVYYGPILLGKLNLKKGFKRI